MNNLNYRCRQLNLKINNVLRKLKKFYLAFMYREILLPDVHSGFSGSHGRLPTNDGPMFENMIFASKLFKTLLLCLLFTSLCGRNWGVFISGKSYDFSNRRFFGAFDVPVNLQSIRSLISLISFMATDIGMSIFWQSSLSSFVFILRNSTVRYCMPFEGPPPTYRSWESVSGVFM